ncbi:MAG: hypothetical protein JO345_12310 [Streptosporangiaceae bacterium]|nr:hypothetical protein [Streptosporangiaceae bacterium]
MAWRQAPRGRRSRLPVVLPMGSLSAMAEENLLFSRQKVFALARRSASPTAGPVPCS